MPPDEGQKMKPVIIPVFLPGAACPRQCVFCNQKATGKIIPSPDSVREFVARSLRSVPPEAAGREKEVAFYGGSFTLLSAEEQAAYLEALSPFQSSGRIRSIRVSTRPDAVGEKVLSLLKEHGVGTVELGAQSMVDTVLQFAARGHKAQDTASAVSRLKEWGFETGLHLMAGLPGDALPLFLESVDQVIALKPDFVRIHPTLVLKGSLLETLWSSGRYGPLTLDEATAWLKEGVIRFKRNAIPIARIGLQPTEALERELLAGPYHPALHQIVDSEIAFDRASHLLEGRPEVSRAVFYCHPKEISNVRGHRNKNIARLKDRFNLEEIAVRTVCDLPRETLVLDSGKEVLPSPSDVHISLTNYDSGQQ
jgi:histone acetyltransferase (RNA polymerase elongator complex component)